MMLRLARLAALAMIGIACGHAHAQTDAAVDRLVAAIEQATPAALERHDAPGAGVAFVYGNRLAWSGGFGLADVGSSRPVTDDTVFSIASVTKPITAWGVLKLAEQGRLDLDAPIQSYVTRWRLPPSEFDATMVTARRILAHAAGLSEGGDPGVEPGQPVPTLEQAADGVGMEGGGIFIATQPGAAYHYSSKGYLLLEIAIEEITGESFAAFMTREVLAPLGMTSSGFDLTPELSARLATGYDWYGRPHPRYEQPTNAQGGLFATAADVARFFAATMPGADGEPVGRGVLSPASVAETFKPVAFTNDQSLIGLGYNLYTGTGSLVARKTGDARGWKAIAFVVPERGAAIAVLTNSDRAAAGVFADIACPWSQAMEGDPLSQVCGQMHMFRDVQLAVAAVLFAVFLTYDLWLVISLRRGRRATDWRVSPRRTARVAVLGLFVAAWWVFWYTDIPLRLMGYPPTFVTVRFDPWPTVFVWISWAVTLLVTAFIVSAFLPRRRSQPA